MALRALSTRKTKKGLLSLSFLLVLAVLFTACGGSQTQVSHKQVPLVIVPNTGGDYTRVFNPYQVGTNTYYGAQGLIYETLLFFNRMDGSVKPWLATSYHFSSNATSITFTLRQGVKWSDGQLLTSDDVVFTHTSAQEREQILALLDRVSLSPAKQFITKFPHQLSGGQRQRVAIARALAAQPEVLLADEPVLMLDVSIRLDILNLLLRLKDEEQLALLFITHDIASARYFSDETLVMYAGQLVEGGPSEEVIQRPRHPYTQLLLSAAPDPDRLGPDGKSERTLQDRGEIPSLINPPGGCRFHPRCPHAMPICSQRFPQRTNLGGGHWSHCFLYIDREINAVPGDGLEGKQTNSKQ